MSSSVRSGPRIEVLGNHPELIKPVARMVWREWGHPPEPVAFDWWLDVTRREAGTRELPITWVAIDDAGTLLGKVGIGEFELDELRDRSPWVLGMIVDPAHRHRGVGSRLLAALERWAAEHAYQEIWVATGEQAVDFYRRCGWELAKHVDKNDGGVALVLSRDLSTQRG